MLKIDNIHTYYGDSYILQGVIMDVRPNAIIAILGRNGMGKTTLMRSVMGFNHPRQGKIFYNEIDVTNMTPYHISRLGISLVPQGRQIFQSLSVEENLKVAFSKRDEGWTIKQIYNLFQPLEKRRRQMGGSLSGGEQQMLAISRSLMTNPSLLLMDEPTEGLAPIFVQTLGEVTRHLNSKGISILMVEQKLGFAIKYADHIHIMGKGKIVFSSSPEELKSNQEIRDRYLGV